LLTGTNLKDQVISKLSPSFLSSAVNIWSDYVISNLSVPVDVYNWDADWLRNWYIKTLGNVGALLNELPLVRIIEFHMNVLSAFCGNTFPGSASYENAKIGSVRYEFYAEPITYLCYPWFTSLQLNHYFFIPLIYGLYNL